MSTTPDTGEVPANGGALTAVNEAIDRLIAQHPDKARQAVERPALQGWFAAKIMNEFNGYGDYATTCTLVSERLTTRQESRT